MADETLERRVALEGVVFGDPKSVQPCHACGAMQQHGTAYGIDAHPALWFPDVTYSPMNNHLCLYERLFCCGARKGTEPVATIGAYLAPVKEHARMVCLLVNQHRLCGRAEPRWLREAWDRWELEFHRPKEPDLRRR